MDFWNLLEEAVKVYCLYAFGSLSKSMCCTKCNPELQDFFNCGGVKESDSPVYANEVLDREYYQCPLSIVPTFLVDYIQQYEDEQNFKTFRTLRETREMEYLYSFVVKKYIIYKRLYKGK